MIADKERWEEERQRWILELDEILIQVETETKIEKLNREIKKNLSKLN